MIAKAKFFGVFTSLFLFGINCTVLIDTCSSTIEYQKDQSDVLSIINKISSEIESNPEFKATLKDDPQQLDKIKQNLLKCCEVILRKSYFKALESMIDTVLEPLNIDISENIKNIGNSIKKQIDSVVNYASSKKNVQKITPAFLWAQSKSHIVLRVKFAHRHDAPGCLDISKEKVEFTNTSMHFSAFGIQAHSPINFVLDLNFREPILANESTWTLESVGRMFVNITKAEPKIWLSLLPQGQKNQKMKIWWEMKEVYKTDMEEFSKLLEEEDDKKQEDIWKKKKKSKKQQPQKDEESAEKKKDKSAENIETEEQPDE